MGYIYKIVNDINDKVYIGKTSRNIEERWKEHIRQAKNCFQNKEKSYIHYAMNFYGVEHFKMECLEKNIDNDILNEREKYYIHLFNSQNNGYNLTPGGDGRSLSNDQIKKIYVLWDEGKTVQEISEILQISSSTISHRLTNYSNYSRKEAAVRSNGTPVDQYDVNGNYLASFDSATKAGLAIGHTNGEILAACSKNTKCGKYYWRRKGEPFDFPLSTKKEVLQLDKDTLEIIQIFSGAREAARQLGMSSASGIIKCCNGVQKTSNGYKWQYTDTASQEINRKNNNKTKKVDKLNLKGEYIQTYNSLSEAAQDVGKNANNISSCCLGMQQTCAGFKWRYHNE